eukprot:tig00021357_g20795.t1
MLRLASAGLRAAVAPAALPQLAREEACYALFEAQRGLATAAKKKKKKFAVPRPAQRYDLTEAVRLTKCLATARFDETMNVAVNLLIDPRVGTNIVRGFAQLPHGTGKKVRVAVFARGEKASEAAAAGADVVGAEDLVAQVKEGKIEFDKALATPDVMAIVGRVAPVLGPRGLMPNPKMGTVTTDIAGAVRAAKAGKVDFRNDKAGIIHAGLGKVSWPEEKLAENVKEFVAALLRARPAAITGEYIAKVTLSSTMGGGVSVELGSIHESLAPRAPKRAASPAPPRRPRRRPRMKPRARAACSCNRTRVHAERPLLSAPACTQPFGT